MAHDLPADRLGNPSVRPAILSAGGIYDVAPEVFAWADEMAALMRWRFGGRPVRMHLRAYHHGQEHLSCDFTDGPGEVDYVMTFIVDDSFWLSPTEPRTPHLTEALFLAGLLADRVGAMTTVDVASV